MPPLPQPTARLLAVRKPAGAAEALIAYLPFAETYQSRQLVVSALKSVAIRDGKTDPALTAALSDKVSVRRQCAAEALLQLGGVEDRKAIRKLLQDSDPQVRTTVGMALIAAGDREAIPGLIEMLADLPLDSGRPVEEVLARLAQDKAPTVPLEGDETARKKCRDAWAKWWKDEGEKIDLAKIDNPKWLFGQTLLVEPQTGRVLELDQRGNVCWQINNLPAVVDAQATSNAHVLVLENNGYTLTERDLGGKVLWSRPAPQGQQYVAFKRLPNGNTFLATHHQIVEIDKDKKELFNIGRQGDIYTAHRFEDGSFAFVTNGGGPTPLTYFRMDSTQKEVKNFRVTNFQQFYPSSIEILPEDRVLIVHPQTNKVIEYDEAGKSVWEAGIAAPMHAIRLTNGNTLVASPGTAHTTELDKSGKVVWEYTENVRPNRVHRK
jgi:hypothetical protein